MDDRKAHSQGVPLVTTAERMESSIHNLLSCVASESTRLHITTYSTPAARPHEMDLHGRHIKAF
jgi:hypothetical protein